MKAGKGEAYCHTVNHALDNCHSTCCDIANQGSDIGHWHTPDSVIVYCAAPAYQAHVPAHAALPVQCLFMTPC